MSKENSKPMNPNDNSQPQTSARKDKAATKPPTKQSVTSFLTSTRQSLKKMELGKKPAPLPRKPSRTICIPKLDSTGIHKPQEPTDSPVITRAQSAAESLKAFRENVTSPLEVEKPKVHSQPLIDNFGPTQKKAGKRDLKALQLPAGKGGSRPFIIKHKRPESGENRKPPLSTSPPIEEEEVDAVIQKPIEDLAPQLKKFCSYSPNTISEERKSDVSSLTSNKTIQKDEVNSSKNDETHFSHIRFENSSDSKGKGSSNPGSGSPAKSTNRQKKEMLNVILKKEGTIDFDVRIGQILGEGAYGRVFEAFNLDTGNFIAVKEIDIEEAQQKPSLNVETLCEEIELYQKLEHENIVRYLGAKQEKDIAYIYMELMPGGSISSMLKQFGPFEEIVIRKFTRQMALGLNYLHDMRVIHRDIKGANILSDGNGNVKLADFGAAKHIDYLPFVASVSSSDLCTSIKGSLYWMAPEILNQKKHGRKIDIWSLGCTIIEMATANHPWPDVKNYTDLVLAMMLRKCPPIPETLSPCARDFISKCCQFDPKQRSKIKDLLEHPFIKDLSSS